MKTAIFALDLGSLVQAHAQSHTPPPPKLSTKDRILAATETLFIARGFDGTSLRAITTEAAVNLAAVNYHFGSKEEMFTVVLTRRLDAMNTERLRRLDALEVSGFDSAHAVEQIIATLFLPALALSRDSELGGPDFLRLLGRAYADPSPFVRTLLTERYATTNARFKAAFARALPDLDQHDLTMRLHFILDSLAATLAAEDVRKLVMAIDGAQRPHTDADDVNFLAYLTPFLAAGLRASVRQPKQVNALRTLVDIASRNATA
jgi:AcrR family transcriptional regulator